MKQNYMFKKTSLEVESKWKQMNLYMCSVVRTSTLRRTILSDFKDTNLTVYPQREIF